MLKITNVFSRIFFAALVGIGFSWNTALEAADHADAPLVSNDQGADIADVYAFLDPNDNSRLTLIVTSRGFITPGESENLGFFSDTLIWRFAIETSGDARPDINATITFSPRTDFLQPQVASVRLTQGKRRLASFKAVTTPACATCSESPLLAVTTDPASDVSFFAGMTDDPFFFDVPAELLFRDSLARSAPNPAVFERAMDTFAGFNVMSVALSIPLTLLHADDNPAVGVSGSIGERKAKGNKKGQKKSKPERGFATLDRMGIPLINSALIPYPRKDDYNRGSTTDDAAGVYSEDIAASLRALGTSDVNIRRLASIAVVNGDMLRLDTRIPNPGPQGDSNGNAGFPNGRRLADDPIDIIVNVIANQLFERPDGSVKSVDGVDENDRLFGDVFPFLAPPHQPVFPGVNENRFD